MKVFIPLLFYLITINFQGKAQHLSNTNTGIRNELLSETTAKTDITNQYEVSTHVQKSKKRPGAPPFITTSTTVAPLGEFFDDASYLTETETSSKERGSSIVPRKGVVDEVYTNDTSITVPHPTKEEPTQSEEDTESPKEDINIPEVTSAEKTLENATDDSLHNSSNETALEEGDNTHSIKKKMEANWDHEDSSEETMKEEDEEEIITQKMTEIKLQKTTLNDSSSDTLDIPAIPKALPNDTISDLLVTAEPPQDIMSVPLFTSNDSSVTTDSLNPDKDYGNITLTTPLTPDAATNGSILVSSPMSKPSTASMGDINEPAQKSSNAAIIVAILIVVTVCALIGFVSYRRLNAYWNRRHYSRVDYLIDGLYEM